ncbi:MAG: transporter [Verrucomicrobiae bacterium]|nr:transporter [Verrucomicrobiae bacterium]
MKPMRLTIFPVLLLASASARADHPTLSLEDGSPGPITTISAVPLPEGTLSAAFVNQFIFFNGLSDSELLAHYGGKDVVHSTDRVISSSLNTAYGLSDNFTLGFSLPYLSRTNIREAVSTHGHGGAGHGHEEPTPKHGGEEHGEEHGEENEAALNRPIVENIGDSDGLGDVTMYAQYRFYSDEAADLHLSAITGLKMPTGDTDVLGTSGYLLEAHHQPGSGSWDPMIGLAFTKGFGRWSIDANALYLFANEGTQGSNLGDVFNYNAGVSYRLIGAHDENAPHQHGVAHEHPTTLDLILEANGDSREKILEGGAVDSNTGGNLIFLSGGTRLAWGHSWAATLSVGAPVLEDLNGIQSEPVMRLLFGVSKAF